MADVSKDTLLEQDQLIQIPETLLSLAMASSAVRAASCDTAQTDCTSCLGAPCQGTNCLSSCQGQCSQSCSQTCSQGCSQTCSQSCSQTCSQSCSQDCSQSCSQTCSQGCSQSCSQTPTVSPPTASGSMSITRVGSDYVTVSLSSIGKATSYEVVWRKATTTTLEGSQETTSRTCTISGLEPDTAYVFNYRGVNDGGYGPFMSTGKNVTTLPNRPDDWEWWSSIVSGGKVGLSAAEWNAFCDWINEFRSYKGLSHYTGFITAYRGDRISAAIVNPAVRAIQAMNPPISPPSTVRSGSPLRASFFHQLSNALNSIS